MHNDPATQTHIQTLQGIIDRMAANSAQCKAWCLTLVSALIVLVIDKGQPDAVFVGTIPVVLFAFMDVYYLSLERDIRSVQQRFVETLNQHENKEEVTRAWFTVPIPADRAHRPRCMLACVWSISIWPFYLALAVSLLICRMLLP